MAKLENIVENTLNYWVKTLHTLPQEQVGVIKASGKLLEGANLLQLASEIAYLSKKEFYLPLVIGGGPYYDALCKDAKKVNGLRITDESLMKKIVPKANENIDEVVDAIKKTGIDAIAIPFEAIYVVPHGKEIDINGLEIDTGFVGDIANINTKPIIQAIYNKQIPVLSHIGIFNDKYYNINATSVAKELVKFLQAKKLIILGDTPVKNVEGDIISTINSELEFKKLVQDGTIKGGMIKNVEEAYDLLKYLGPGHCVQISSLKFNNGDDIVSSTGLREELLGDGNGTQIWEPFVITSYPLNAVSPFDIKNSIDEVFIKELGKKLKKDYIDIISPENPTIYLTSKKAGGAISYKIDGCEYLCKIFIDKDYSGLGLGTSIMDTIILQKGPLCWRASVKNEGGIIFYDKIETQYKNKGIAAFSKVSGDYKVYIIGLPEEKSHNIIRQVVNIPATLIPL